MPNFNASNDRPVETTNGGDGSDESQHSKRRLPSNTLAALGVLPDEIQTRIRDIKLPEELKSLTEPQLLRAIIDFFSANETSTRVARIADKALYETAEELNRKAGLSIESIHDFANRYFALEGDASKSFLIYSISSFLEDLYRVYGELNELLLEAERKKHNPHKLGLPDLCISNKCDVLRPSVGEDRWESAGTFSLELPSLPSPNKIADVVNYSYKINPHSHLLVEGHYVVSPEGSVQIVSVPQLPSSPNHQLGKSSMTLRFNREYSGNNAPEISRFSITTIRKLDSSNSDSAQYEVTYTADPEKERGISHSPLSCHKAELCVPETFTKLVEKFAELNLPIEEKAQLVAQFFSSQKLIYSRHPQLSELLSACDSKHRISLVLGLGVGDCLSLALVLQQLLAHAGVSAAVEWGAVCSADGKSYKSPPAHARVKVYGSNSILRLDPTTWCVRNISIGTMEGKSLGALKCELVNADAKTSYQVGQRARRLITTAALSGSDGRSAISRSDIWNTDARKNAPSSINGHRLKDDFNHQSKAKLHRLLAANEQEVLVAQVWEAYEKALESAQYDTFVQDVGILLQEEVKLVGLQQSKICAALPKMVQTIYRVGRPSTLFFCDLIERIQSPEAQAYLLSHTLNRNTLSDCVEFLFTGTLPPSAESTRFLVRLIHLIADVRGTDLSDDGAHTCQVLLLQAAQFPKHYRDAITRAFSNTFGEDLDCLINLLCSSGKSYYFSPKALPSGTLESIFPALKNSPIEVAKGVFAALSEILSREDSEDKEQNIDLNIGAHLIFGQYFPPHVHQDLKSLITTIVAAHLRGSEKKSIDFTSSPAVSELCNLAHIVCRSGDLEGGQFCSAYDLIRNRCDSDLLTEFSPIDQFNRGYLLKELYALGLLDLNEIADCLYTPSTQEIKAAFDELDITTTWKAGFYPNHDDAIEIHKAFQLSIAILARSIRKGITVPHSKLVLDAVEFGVTDKATLDLAKIVLNRRKPKIMKDILEATIPNTVAYLLSIRDSLRLRSYVRIKTALALLDTDHLGNEYLEDFIKRLKQVFLDSDSALSTQNNAYPRMAQLYCYTNSSLLAMESEHDIFERVWGHARDGASSLRSLHKMIQRGHNMLIRQDRPNDILERTRHIVLSLLNQFPHAPKVTFPVNRVDSRVWQDAVTKSLRIQQSDGGARLLRKISQSRNENFNSNRSYVPGDDLRAIDWRASGKNADLIVRNYQKSSRSIADSYHVLVDLADVIESPKFGFFDVDSDEFKMSELNTNTNMLSAITRFVYSLAEENKQVRLSVFAFGARVIDTIVATDRGSPNEDLSARSNGLEALSNFASRYADLCDSAQCVPDACCIDGLMNSAERLSFRGDTDPGRLVIHLQGKASAKNPIDPALKELAATGKAARVLLEI